MVKIGPRISNVPSTLALDKKKENIKGEGEERWELTLGTTLLLQPLHLTFILHCFATSWLIDPSESTPAY